jgi:site-specific DNA-methyltransferase (adenine-specific)
MKPYYENDLTTIYNGNCLEVMDNLIEEGTKVDCVITSPPYDDIKNYNNTLSWNFDIFKKVAKRLYELLNVGGTIIWVVGDKTHNGSESLTSFNQVIYFNSIGFNLHDTMIYRKKNYVPLTHNRYEQEFEYIFVLTKGKIKTFNPIKIQCKYAGTSTYGKPSYYKNEDDTLTNTKEKLIINDYKIKGNIFEYNTGSMYTGNIKHPAMFPFDLAKDMIQSWTNKGDIILDCFAGSFTTNVFSEQMNRINIGIELETKYCDIGIDRLSKLQMRMDI